MRISADRMAAEGLRVKIPRLGLDPHIIQLGPSRGVTGTYEQSPEVFRLDDVRGEEVAFARIEWHLESGLIDFASGTILRDAHLDFSIDRVGLAGFVGTARAASAVSKLAVIRIGEIEVRGAIALTDVAYTRAGSGAWSIRAEAATITNATLQYGEMHVEIGALTLRGARLGVEGGAPSLETHALDIGSASIRVGPFVFGMDEVSVPRGVRFAKDRLELAEAAARRLRVEVLDLRDLMPAEPPEPPRLEPGHRRGTAPFDLRFVDGLNGQIDLDLTVDAKFSVVRRKKTHKFRIPLRDGEINFRSLENDLGTLEDAFIDIEVREGKLSIENDIPLLPGYFRSLVLFRLDPEDVARAEQTQWVKLRQFAEWELPGSDRPKKKTRKKKNPFELKALDFNGIEVRLRLDQPSRIDLGERGAVQLGLDPDRPPLASFGLSGDVHYRPGEVPVEGHLHAQLAGLHLALDRLLVGTRRVSVGEAHLTRVNPATLRFLGARPDHLEVVFEGVSMSQVLAEPEPAQDAPEDASAAPADAGPGPAAEPNTAD